MAERTSTSSPFLGPHIKQCAIVVRDLDEAVRRFVADLEIELGILGCKFQRDLPAAAFSPGFAV